MPRPTNFSEVASQSIRVRVTPDQRRSLEEVARENRAALATIIRDAVDDYVSDYRDRSVFRGTKPPRA